MKSQITTDPLSFPFSAPESVPGSIPFAAVIPPIPGGNDPLTEVLRRGAHTLLTQAVEAEVTQWLATHAHVVDEQGHQQVVRNGYAQERTIVTGVGPLAVTMPRVHDRRSIPEREKFTSALLPPYLRKTKSIEELLPWLYLKGISTGDFGDALAALLGPDCPGLSASTITRLKEVWEADFRGWQQRDLKGKHYVYIWADGIYFNIRLADPPGERACILVLLGATADGTKEVIAVQDGHRESEQSWSGMLLDLKARGLTTDPKLAIGDGALGFWAALRKAFPTTREQRCWVHKTVNVLDQLPKCLHGQAKDKLHQIWMAPRKQDALQAFDLFIQTYQNKYPEATARLEKDREELLAFYDYPAEHWAHLRTTNPIESMFATVRLRTVKTKGCGSRLATLTMVYQLALTAQKSFRKLNGHALLEAVIAGVIFTDGVQAKAA